MPPIRRVRPSGSVMSSVPRRSLEAKPNASRTTRGKSASTVSTVAGVTQIRGRHRQPHRSMRLWGSGQVCPSLDQSALPRSGLRPAAGNVGPSIVAALGGRQGGIHRVSRCSNWSRHQTHALQPQPQGFPMDSRNDLKGNERQREERAQQRRRGECAAAANEGRRQQGAFVVGLEDPQFDIVARRGDAEVICIAISTKGETWNSLSCCCLTPGLADLAWTSPAARKRGFRRRCCALRRSIRASSPLARASRNRPTAD